MAARGRREVLERVPEDDRRPAPSPRRPRAARRASRSRSGSRSRPTASPPASRAGRRRSVPSPAPTSRIGPGGAMRVEPGRQQRTGAGEQRVADEVKAAAGPRAGTSRRRRRPSSASLGPRIGGGGPAASAAGRPRMRRHPVESGPHQAQARRARRSSRPAGLGQSRRPADRAQVEAPRRARSSRSSKSSGSIAAARDPRREPAAPKHGVVEALPPRRGTRRRIRRGSSAQEAVDRARSSSKSSM